MPYQKLFLPAYDGPAWLLLHSGTVDALFAAVQAVAGALSSGEDAANSFTVDFARATERLEDTAEQRIPSLPEVPLPNKDSSSITTVTGRSGVWTTRPVVTSNGILNQQCYQDLAIWLGMTGVPATFKDSTGRISDVAMIIGLAMFANQAALPSDKPGTGSPGDPVLTTSFSMASADKSLSISGCCAYYDLPLGEGKAASENRALHSAIKIQVTMAAASASKVQRLPPTPRSGLAVSSTQWLVTGQIMWTSVPLAQQAVLVFFDTWSKDCADYVVVLDIVEGVLQIIKILAPPKVVPADVWTAINAALIKTVELLNPGSNVSTLQAPIFDLTNATLITGDN
jgi:hypothetical protein